MSTPSHLTAGMSASLKIQLAEPAVEKGAELEGHYVALLRELGTRPGMLGKIFIKAQNKIQDPAKPRSQPEPMDKTGLVLRLPHQYSPHFEEKPMRYENLSDFVNCYNPLNRRQRKATWDETDSPEGRWRSYSYEEIKARDKTSLDIFWLKDKSLTDLDNLPEPDVLAEEIIENLEAGLNSFREVLARLRSGKDENA